MVDRLSRGPASVSALARPLAMWLPAVLQGKRELLDALGEALRRELAKACE